MLAPRLQDKQQPHIRPAARWDGAAPPSPPAKSQHITKSDDYTAIHSYYPRGGKHEPFQAAALQFSNTLQSGALTHSRALFFPKH
ncbi:hypothetical protein EYF80_005467 [Liparis tanakae]|uniref:Uncharacterized protein n=1 Tax=Liparis tanakae TaxID=230148 RepID=A0A4Z2J1K5_9TELE|nr:hypothetical protein EYF80_005467 [Liparis tanakae]